MSFTDLRSPAGWTSAESLVESPLSNNFGKPANSSELKRQILLIVNFDSEYDLDPRYRLSKINSCCFVNNCGLQISARSPTRRSPPISPRIFSISPTPTFHLAPPPVTYLTSPLSPPSSAPHIVFLSFKSIIRIGSNNGRSSSSSGPYSRHPCPQPFGDSAILTPAQLSLSFQSQSPPSP